MGFTARNKGGANFVGVSNGYLTVPCKEDDEDAVGREVTKGKRAGQMVYEQHHDSYEGHITKVYIQESNDPKYPDKLCIVVTDKKAKSSITIGVANDSSYAVKFYQVMKSIKLNEPVEFAPYKMPKEKGDGYATGWTIYQDGEKLTNSWEKDETPQWEKIEKKVPGKKNKDGTPVMTITWDKSEQIEFFLKHLHKWVEKNDLGKESKDEEGEDEEDEKPAKTKASSKSSSSKKKSKSDDEDEDEDDIDF